MTSKDLIPVAEIESALAELSSPDWQDALRDITIFDLPRFSAAPGSTSSFAGGETSVVGVILKVNQQRVFWAGQPAGGNTRPVCIARDGLHGEPDLVLVDELGLKPTPGGPCLPCPYAEFNSIRWLNIAGREKSRAKACSDVRHLFVWRGGQHLLPALIKCAPSSLKNLRRYQVDLMDKRQALIDVVSEVSIEPGHSSGNEYGVLKFKTLSQLDTNTRSAIEVYRQQIEPWLTMAPVLSHEKIVVCGECEYQWIAPPDDACPGCGVVLSTEAKS